MGTPQKTSDRVLCPELSYALQSAFYEVYKILGPGFREETYRQALRPELRLRGIPFETEKYYDIPYTSDMADRYRADFVVDGKIIVELKAVVTMPPHFEAYLMSYLRASKLRLGYLANFGAARLQVERCSV